MSQAIKRAGLGAMLGFLATGSIGACGGGTSATALGEQPVLSGQFASWTYGSDAVIKTFIQNSTSGNTILTTAPIDASGAFSLMLPSGSQVAAKYEYIGGGYYCKSLASCPVTSTPTMVNRAGITFSVQLKPSDPREYMTLYYKGPVGAGKNFGYVFYYYYDKDIDISGTAPYTTAPGPVTVDVHARAGWNIEVNEYTASALNVLSEPPPAEYKWSVIQ